MPTQSTPAQPPEQVRIVQLIRREQPLKGYYVGDNGVVYSSWRRVGVGVIGWEVGDELRPLVAYPIGRTGGYLGVALRHLGRSVRASVHTLVMESFVGPYPDGQEVCYNDGNGHNNRLANLRYGTRSENLADRRLHGTHQDGQRNPQAKLTDAQAEDIRQLRSSGFKLRVIAERFGVRESTVSRIANGVRRAR